MRVKYRVLMFCLVLVLFATLSITSYAEPVVLNMWTVQGHFPERLMPAVDMFNELHEGRIRVDVIPLAHSSYLQQVMTALATGGDTFDIVPVNDQHIGQLAPFLAELGTEERPIDLDQISLGALQMGTWQDVLYGMPVSAGVNVLFMRQDLFEEAGLKAPQYLDEYLEAAKLLTKDYTGDGVPDVWGATMYAGGTTWTTIDFITYLRAHKGRILDPTLRFSQLDQPEALAAAEFYVDLFRKHQVVPPGSLGWAENPEAYQAFQEGLMAQYVGYSPRAIVISDPAVSRVAGNVAFARVPTARGVEPQSGTHYIAGWVLGINKRSRHVDEALEFLRYITSYDVQRYLAINHGNGPIRLDVLESAEYLAVNPAGLAERDTMPFAITRPPVPEWQRIDDIIAEELAFALTDRKTPEQALLSAHQKINRVLGN